MVSQTAAPPCLCGCTYIRDHYVAGEENIVADALSQPPAGAEWFCPPLQGCSPGPGWPWNRPRGSSSNNCGNPPHSSWRRCLCKTCRSGVTWQLEHPLPGPPRHRSYYLAGQATYVKEWCRERVACQCARSPPSPPHQWIRSRSLRSGFLFSHIHNSQVPGWPMTNSSRGVLLPPHGKHTVV